MKAMMRWAVALGVLVLSIGGAEMMGACGSDGSGLPSSCPPPPDPPPAEPTTCPAQVEYPCMRYHIPLVGNPSMDVALRNKYIDAFGDACYMSELDTFDCFYKTWQKACADAAKIGQVSGNAPYDQSYTCQPVAGTEDYTLQIGSDVANYITINYQAAPRQSPLVEVDGVPTAVNGPYRDLMEPPTLGPGQPFAECFSGMFDADGGALSQRNWIIQVNQKKYGGEIHSDLAGFEYPCGVDENCNPKTCKEELVLKAGPKEDPNAAQVHHVVPMNDKRNCSWGTNSNKNAAVISARLNQYFTNNNPPAEEVKLLNSAEAYTP
ncbi:MAG: hypothetical protein U0359_03525 [Byssovorax sp.]